MRQAPSRSPWSLRAAVLAMLAWIPLSCDFPDPVAPDARSRLVSPPQLSEYAPSLDTIMSAPFPIPAPPGGTYSLHWDSAQAATYEVAQVVEGSYVRGTLTGNISGTFSPDSLCTSDPGFNAEVYQEESVGFHFVGGAGGYLARRTGDPQAGEVTYMGWIPGSTAINATRIFPGACNHLLEAPDQIVYVSGYEYSGSQQVFFEPIMPFEVTATPDFVVNGGSIEFDMTSEYPVTGQRWYFQPGDTTDVPSGLTAPGPGCPDDSNSCTIALPSSGRMYMAGEVDGLINVTIASNIVWVRDSIPATCGTPSEPVPGPGEGPACPEKLTLGCDAPSLIRTDSISCRVFFPSGATTSNVTGWRFVGGENDEFVIEDSVVLDSIWKGAMVASGAITVFADVDTVADSASVLVQVNPRSWTVTNLLSKVDYEVGPTDALWVGDMDAVPDSAGELGHSHYNNRLLNGAYPGGGTIKVVEGGPNDSLSYNANSPYYAADAWIEINRDALENDANAWHAGHPNGGKAPKSGSDPCREDDLDGLVLPAVIEHEGYHIAYADQWWSQPAASLNVSAESVVLRGRGQPDPLQLVVDTTFARWVRDVTTQRDYNQTETHALYPPILPCLPDFP